MVLEFIYFDLHSFIYYTLSYTIITNKTVNYNFWRLARYFVSLPAKKETAMKKSIIVMMMALLMVACSTLTPAEKAERQAKVAQAVKKALSERHYKVGISMMYPPRGKAVNVSPDYSLEVKGDTLISYLPYFGRAYNVPYGGGKGLNFTAPISEYSSEKGRKGATQVTIKVTNEEDIYTYLLEIYDTGSTSVDVRSRERESIRYSGNMEGIESGK